MKVKANFINSAICVLITVLLILGIITDIVYALDGQLGYGGYSGRIYSDNGYSGRVFSDNGYSGRVYSDNGSPDRGYSDNESPDKVYADNESPDKVYADKGYLDTGSSDNGYPDKVYADKGYLDTGSSDNGYPDKVYADKGYLDIGSSDNGSQDRGYSDKAHSDKDFLDTKYPDRGYSDRRYSDRRYSDRGYTNNRYLDKKNSNAVNSQIINSSNTSLNTENSSNWDSNIFNLSTNDLRTGNQSAVNPSIKNSQITNSSKGYSNILNSSYRDYGEGVGFSYSSSSGMSLVSREPEGNVAAKELATKNGTSGNHIIYIFPGNRTCIKFIEYDAEKIPLKATTTVEELKSKSVFIPKLPVGRVYKHVNIWIGNEGRDLPISLKNGLIGFRVEKAWIHDKKGKELLIVLQRYNKSWEPLYTEKVGEDDVYAYFRSKTPGFSSFAVTEYTGEVTKNGAQAESKLKDTSRSRGKGGEVAIKGISNNNNRAKQAKDVAKILMAISLPLILAGYFVFRKRI